MKKRNALCELKITCVPAKFAPMFQNQNYPKCSYLRYVNVTIYLPEGLFDLNLRPLHYLNFSICDLSNLDFNKFSSFLNLFA